MPKEKFLLVSLQEDKAKKLAQVITNDSCRKILDYLAEKDATESELAEKLVIPISTVHYNLKQLVDGGLVVSEEFHYSEKGKEVNHYRLANKYIIIAPKTVYGIKEKLRSILPVVLIVGAGAAFIQFFVSRLIRGPLVTVLSDTKQTILRDTVVGAQYARAPPAPLMATAGGMAEKAAGAVAQVNQTAAEVFNRTTEQVLSPQVSVHTISAPGSVLANIAVWFVIGAISALAIYFFVDYLRSRK